jgi:hypothetical protein
MKTDVEHFAAIRKKARQKAARLTKARAMVVPLWAASVGTRKGARWADVLEVLDDKIVGLESIIHAYRVKKP